MTTYKLNRIDIKPTKMNITHSVIMEDATLLFNQEVFFCKNWGVIKVHKFACMERGYAHTAWPEHRHCYVWRIPKRRHIRQWFTWINIFSYSNLHATVVCRRVKFSCVTPNSTIKPPLHSHNPPSPLQEILPLTPPHLFRFMVRWVW